MSGLRGDAAIVGIAEWAPERRPTREMFSIEAISELAREAIADAGLDARDIDGMLTTGIREAAFLVPSTVAEYCGFRARFAEVVDLGGASGAAMVWRAAAAIELGMCDTCVCVIPAAIQPRDPRRDQGGGPAKYGYGDWGGGVWGSPQAEFEIPYGAMAGNYGYALIANRYAHEYGLPEECLPRIAVQQRENALRNPKAVFRDQPITVEDVLNSPMVCDPLHMLEIVMPCFGGAAVVVSSRKTAARSAHRPAWIIGAGEYLTHKSITYAPDLLNSPIKPAADLAFAMAGVKRGDVDFASLYDCYTITVLLTIEDAGFCAKGEGARFVMGHDMTWKGDFPMNTHGGQLSMGQSGGAGGMSHVTEAVLQLQGRAEGRQIGNCNTVYVNNNGGLMSEQVSIVLRGD
jgi:acetyl-CoA acetyltransferase